MSATEELRRMLTERGMEWETTGWPAECQTFYEAGGVGYIAIGLDDELGDSRMRVCLEEYMTPEQVVEATLGRGTCRNTEQLPLSWSFTCSECGVHSITEGERFNYCPNCGAEVVSE